MSHILAIASALLLLSGEPTSTLQRQRHDDTIYIVRGTVDQLTRFQTDIASHWDGGRLLTKDDAEGLYRYWAYPDRTAPQAREFMFGAMRSGLFLDIIAYDERLPFRGERSALDAIATGCGLIHDPFFITPMGELKVSFDTAEPPQAVSCATKKLKRASLPNVVKRPAT
ncbi:hypothetical protein [Sphingomonas sp.]|uniref:hypothetical protein n=1 Tax=Sphingomonas sp. TaxID=28214 RepID=UPI0038AA847F